MLGSGTFRLEPPRLRTNEDPASERHATWYELFFDLVFAAAVIELATALAEDPTSAVFGRFAGLFVAIAWAWTGFAVYANRFDTDDLIYRLIKGGAAFATAALAVEIPRLMAGEGGSMAFAIGYAVVRLLLVALYVRARLHVREQGRRLIDTYIVTITFTAGLWLASIMFPAPYRFIIWGVALALDLCVPPYAWRILGSSTIVVSHITERFGQFFIVVLGVSVASVVGAVSGLQFSFEAWVLAAACFITALSLWWIYFDLADTSVVGRGTLGLVFVYGHFPLLPGIAAFAAGTTLAITEVHRDALEVGGRWALAGGLAVFALALAVMHLGAEWTSLRDRSLLARIVLVAILVGLAALGGGLSPLLFVLLVMAAMLGQLLLEAFTFPTGAASVLQPQEAALGSGGG
ncbi:MAG TPA: low temperature requirement protein A [Solirubrobacterales bacterium]|nr:low temperature requirement protein A [Solirubrobacterales bacterium]